MDCGSGRLPVCVVRMRPVLRLIYFTTFSFARLRCARRNLARSAMAAAAASASVMVRSIRSRAIPRRRRFSMAPLERSDLIAFLIRFASASISSGMVFMGLVYRLRVWLANRSLPAGQGFGIEIQRSIRRAAMKISWETATVDGSAMGLYLSQPDGPGPFPAVIVAQNQDGVAAFTQEMTRRIAAAGYLGIAPQFYHREGEPKTPGETAGFKNTRRDVNVLNDLNATINFLKGCANADTSRLGVVGFCMGGRIAFLAAAATRSFKAAVDFYGGGTYQQWGDRPAPAAL